MTARTDAFSSVREEIADYRSMAAMRAESRENEGLDAQMMWGRVDAYDALLGFMNGDERFTGIASRQPQSASSLGASFEVRSEEEDRLPLVGRDLALVRKLASQLADQGTRGHAVTPMSDYGMAGRGFKFEVLIIEGLEDTGRVAKVTAALDRVKQARPS